MAQIFHLETSSSGLATLTFDLPGSRVNLFTREALEGLRDLLEELPRRSEIRCLILLSAKSTSFCHGVQVDLVSDLQDSEKGTAGAQAGQALFRSWAELPFPTIAAIAATCVGGGTELAVASTYRVLADRDDLRIGLPEVRLGILPGWGGCVRLPRLIGLTEALEMILSGKSLAPYKALKIGLVDAVVPEAGFLNHVRDFALKKLQQGKRRKSDRDLRELLLAGTPLGRRLVFDQARKKVLEKSRGTYPAPLRAVEVIRLGIENGPEAGFAAEARALGELAAGSVSKNLLHVFRLTQTAKKDPTQLPPLKGPGVRRAGVLGAGIMGAGIAYALATKAEIPVSLRDVNREALTQAMESSATQIHNRVKRRRLTAPQGRQAMARLQPTLGATSFGHPDLVLEAITEDLEVKRKVLAEVAERIPATTILASNTSSLTIQRLAETLPNPERVVGLHFFNPVSRIPLVEVVAGEETSGETLAQAFHLLRRLGKTPLLVKDCPGFLVNRLLIFTMTEALWLFSEGLAPADIDRAVKEWGLPVGPFSLLDRVGLDIGFTVADRLSEAYGDRLTIPSWDRKKAFFDAGRLGVKTGSGFYRYGQKRSKESEPRLRTWLDLPAEKKLDDAGTVLDRLILPMVNEAARCLAEGVVASPGQIDLAMVLGAGFPPFRGGLCRWAETRGLSDIVRSLEGLAESVDPRFAPSEALRDLERKGSFSS